MDKNKNDTSTVFADPPIDVPNEKAGAWSVALDSTGGEELYPKYGTGL